MKWLLNFIWLLSLNNYKAINEFICELIKKKWTSRTKTPIDDNSVDEVLKPTLNLWAKCALDPDVTYEQTKLENALLVINFLDDRGLLELEKCIIKKREALNEPNK